MQDRHDWARDMNREHGGNVVAAARQYGVSDMLDLSTGISPVFYPSNTIEAVQWQSLPTEDALDLCIKAARSYYKVPRHLEIVAGPGTQSLLQLIPRFIQQGHVWVKQPTYNEHMPAWQSAGHEVLVGDTLPSAATHAVIVAPNNPTGDADLIGIIEVAEHIARRGGLLLIDGAFADGVFGEDVLRELQGNPSVVHLRSFGKFFGMAGLRLGFAIGQVDLISQLCEGVGPWAVNFAALSLGAEAMSDTQWVASHHRWLELQSKRLVSLLVANNFEILGGTPLFQTVRHDAAHSLHAHLAKNGIWTRVYYDYKDLLRFGLPGNDSGWSRLTSGLQSFNNLVES